MADVEDGTDLPTEPAFRDFFLLTSYPDRREICCYSILYPLPRELNQYAANFLFNLQTRRAPFCEETLITTLHSPETWTPTISITTPPYYRIPEPVGDLIPLIPHRHFLSLWNHRPEFTDRLVMPPSPPHGYTHHQLRTPSPLDLDHHSFSSLTSNEVFDLVLALSPPRSLTPSSSSRATPIPYTPASPSEIADPPSDSSCHHSN